MWLDLLLLLAFVGLFVAERRWRRRADRRRQERLIPEEREHEFDAQARSKSNEIKALYKRGMEEEAKRDAPPPHE